jgi:hypothetical protein
MSTLIAEGFAAWRECREAFDDLLHAQYQLAEDRTNGAMLNERGRQAGIDPWRLFTSNALFRNAYASEELQDHWRDRPHTTYASFEKQWAKDREEPEATVLQESGPWTTERIREGFIDDGGRSEYYDPINGAREQRRIAGAIFDAWLTAHDLETIRLAYPQERE